MTTRKGWKYARKRRDRSRRRTDRKKKKQLAQCVTDGNRPVLKRSLMAGLLGTQTPQLAHGFSDRGFFGRTKLIPEIELKELIKKVEGLINDICLGDPDPILIEKNTLKIRKELSKILKIAKPLADEKRKIEKIQTEIKNLSENKDFKWSSKKRQFIKNKKKVKKK